MKQLPMTILLIIKLILIFPSLVHASGACKIIYNNYWTHAMPTFTYDIEVKVMYSSYLFSQVEIAKIILYDEDTWSFDDQIAELISPGFIATNQWTTFTLNDVKLDDPSFLDLDGFLQLYAEVEFETWGPNEKVLSSIIEVLTLEKITLMGPNQINENSGADFNCIATFCNDEEAYCDNLVTWSAGDTSAEFNSDGYLTTKNVPSDHDLELKVEIGGIYDTLDITIIDIPDTPETDPPEWGPIPVAKPIGDNGWVNNNSVKFYLYATDYSGVDRYEYRKGTSGSWSTACYEDNTPGEYCTISVNDGIGKIYQFRAVDNVGNYSDTVQVSFQVDAKKPTLNIVSAPDQTDDHTPTIQVSASDSTSGLNHYEFILADASQNPLINWQNNGNSGTYTLSYLSAGTYNWQFGVYDKAGNSNQTGWKEIKIVDSPEVPSSPQGVTASSGTYDNRIRIKWDNLSEEDGYKIYRAVNQNGSYIQIGTQSADDTVYYDYCGCGKTYWYKVTAYNSVGESGFSNSNQGNSQDCDSYTVATPTITPAGGSYVSSKQVELSCSTPGATIRYTTNGEIPTSNSLVYTNAILISESCILKVRGFKTGYAESGVATADFTIGGAILSVSPTSRSVSSEAGTTTFSVSNIGTGSMTWAASVVSSANWLSITFVSGGTIYVNYSANNTGSTRTGHIRVASQDADGSPINVAVVQSADVDTTPPTTTITSGPKGNYYNSTVTFEFMGSDDKTPSGDLKYIHKLIGQKDEWLEPWTYSTTATYQNLILGQVYTFQVKSLDLAYHIQTATTSRRFIFGDDKEPPGTHITSGPKGNHYNSTATFEFRGNDNVTDLGDFKYIHRLVGHDNTWSKPWSSSTTKTYSNLIPGQIYTFQVKSLDLAFNIQKTISSRRFIYGEDKEPPGTNITSGPSGNHYSTTAKFNFKGTDNVTYPDDFKYIYRLIGHNNSWSAWTSSATKTYSNLTVGQKYTFQVKSLDLGFNIQTSTTSRKFTVMAGATTSGLKKATSSPNDELGYLAENTDSSFVSDFLAANENSWALTPDVYEDFNDGQGGGFNLYDPAFSLVSNKLLHSKAISPGNKNYYAIWNGGKADGQSDDFYHSNSFENFYVSVDTSWQDGADKQGYGLIYRSNDSDDVIFRINKLGYFNVYVRKDGAMSETTGWKSYNPPIDKPAAKIAIYKVGNDFGFYIDNKQVYSKKLNGYGEGALGVVSSDQVSVSFDDFQIDNLASTINDGLPEYVAIGPVSGFFLIDENDLWFEDFDSDGFGNQNKSMDSGAQPYGYVVLNDDCDDTNPNINPSVPEIVGDGIDQNCDGLDGLPDSYANIGPDLSLLLPNVAYESQLADANQWLGFTYLGNKDGKLIWSLDEQGENFDDVGEPVIIDSNLSFKFTAAYSFLTDNVWLELGFKFYGNEDGKSLWVLESWKMK